MSNASDRSLLAVRIALGGALAAHGTQKLFGWFGGHGIAGTAGFFESVGFKPGKLNAYAAGIGEAGGGTLLALGLATPAAGAAVAGTMVVAASMHKDKGWFAQNGGYEFPAVLGLAGAALALGGPGQLSLDAALDHRLNRPWMQATALVGVIPAAAVVLRRRAAALAAASAALPDDESGSGAPAGA
jgi:putative oxidoreductase